MFGLEPKGVASGDEFEWDDDSVIADFTYWADAPSRESTRNCVSLQVTDGKWRDVSCATENWILCQKFPIWPLKDLQQSILVANRQLQELRHVTSRLIVELNEANKKVQVLLENPNTALLMILIEISLLLLRSPQTPRALTKVVFFT